MRMLHMTDHGLPTHTYTRGAPVPSGFPRLSPCQRPRVSGVLLVEAVASRRRRRAR